MTRLPGCLSAVAGLPFGTLSSSKRVKKKRAPKHPSRAIEHLASKQVPTASDLTDRL